MKAPDQTGSRFFILIFLHFVQRQNCLFSIIYAFSHLFSFHFRMIFFLKNLVPRAVAEISR